MRKLRRLSMLMTTLFVMSLLSVQKTQAEEPEYIGPIDIPSITSYVERDGWSYDPETKTLTLAGVNIDAWTKYYSYTENPSHEKARAGSMFELQPGTTVIVKEGTVNNLVAKYGGDTFVCRSEGDPITIKGGGTLNLQNDEIAIYSQTDMNFENVTINMTEADIFAMLYPGANKVNKDLVLTFDHCHLNIDNCTGGIFNYGTCGNGSDINAALNSMAENDMKTASLVIRNSYVKMKVKLDEGNERNHNAILIRNGCLDIENSTLDLNSYHEAIGVWKTYKTGDAEENLIRLKDVKLPEGVEISSDVITAEKAFIKAETFVTGKDKLKLSFDKRGKFEMGVGALFNNGQKALTMTWLRDPFEVKKEDPKEDPKEEKKEEPKEEKKEDPKEEQPQNPPSDTDKETAISIEDMTNTILTADTDKDDIKGSRFSALCLKAKGGKKKITLTWKKVKDADGYIIFGSKCGKKMKQIAKVTGNKYIAKKLKKGTYYKYTVVAVRGQEVLSTARTVHCITDGGKKGNPLKLTCKKTKISLKKGKTAGIKAKVNAKKKVNYHTSKLRYESSDEGIATVTKKGKVKTVGTGRCVIYIYAQNGLCKKVQMTVK